MAKNTKLDLRNLFIYQIYLRNYNETGTFKELITDLDRLKSLGVDVVYLLPVHPVGQKNKKGDLGCNYSIKDYRSISPEHGTMEDFQELINEVHKRDMKIMIDVVYNHTSHDSLLLKEHPEWFFYRDGKNANRVGDWWDIIDLDYTKDKGLWNYLIETLEMFAKMGIDGYRCDVAPLIPIEFWVEARDAVAKIKEDFIWLSESVHKGFIKYIRDQGYTAHSDSEVYEAFDILYDYDIHEEYMAYLKGEQPLKHFLDAIRNQEVIYPKNYCKLRNLENHDQPRIAQLVSDEDKLRNLTAFNFFVKGTTMIYAGQEAFNTKTPSLFDIDKVDWSTYKERNLDELIKAMAKIQKDPIMANGVFDILDFDANNLIVIKYENETKIRYGIFNVSENTHEIELDIQQGTYINLIDHSNIHVKNHVKVGKQPIVIESIK